MHHRVADQDVHCVRRHVVAQLPDDLDKAVGELLRVLVGVECHQILGPHDPALRDERQQDDSEPLAPVDVQFENAAVGRTGDARRDMYVGQLEQRSHRRQPVGVVVVAGNHHHVLNRHGRGPAVSGRRCRPPPRRV